MDEFIGKTYEDRDSRSDGRRIRVISYYENSLPGDPRYVAEVIANTGNPGTVGRHVLVRPTTLMLHYREVSH